MPDPARLTLAAALAALVALAGPGAAAGQVHEGPKTATATGADGAAASVDPLATQTALRTLRSGGNAVDAAVAAAGVLGVTEPFSCGIGGGGFMLVYDAERRKVGTIDARETAPRSVTPTTFASYGTSTAEFERARVSGLSVGVPGTVRGWKTALQRYGTRPLDRLLRPAARIAREGFVIDRTFADQVEGARAIFDDFSSSRALYLTPEGTTPPPGGVQRNPDLARTYDTLGADPDALYEGPIAEDVAATVREPPIQPGANRPHPIVPGGMTVADLAAYRAEVRSPTVSRFRGLQINGMPPPSSGGTTVGEALNILDGALVPGLDPVEVQHRQLEATKLAFADRDAFVGDPAFVKVPTQGLLSEAFAAERRPLIGPRALPTPQRAGDPWEEDGSPSPGAAAAASAGEEGPSTTHLVVADRDGNVVSYTFTIEQTGGNGMVVPGRGFLLNNELTDFDFPPGRPNSPAPGKRPRSSMAPTIVLDDRRAPVMALGSPGGATIITTIAELLTSTLAFDRGLAEAIAAPRASSRNGASTQAEPGYLATFGPALQALGHRFATTPEIGAATAVRIGPGGQLAAFAEPDRRGGGSAGALPR